MNKFLQLCAFMAFAASCLASTVTATVTDTDGQVWFGGMWTATLTIPGSVFNPDVPKVGGVPVSPLTHKGNLGTNGVISGTFTDTSTVDQAGAKWVFKICPNASNVDPNQSSNSCPQVITTITGATVDLSSVFSQMPAPRFPAGSGSFGYADGEVLLPPPSGSMYFNVIDQCPHQWNGLIWTSCKTGGSGGNGTVNPSLIPYPIGYWHVPGTTVTPNPLGRIDDNGDISTTGNLAMTVTNPLADTTVNITDNWMFDGTVSKSAFSSMSRTTTCGGKGGFNFGNDANVVAAWSTCQMNPWIFNANLRGITQRVGGTLVKNATGDFAWDYASKVYGVGGLTGASDEGGVGWHLNGGEIGEFYQGNVAAGATTGATTLPVTTGNTTCDGCFVSFFDKQFANQTQIINFTGTPTVSANGRYWTEPISIPLTPSTAYAPLDCGTAAIPQLANQGISESVTCTASGILGTSGAFVTGFAALSSTQSEWVTITAVGEVSGGSQSVTFLHRNPTSNESTMLWQGGPAGTVQFNVYEYFNYGNMPEEERVFGATDSTHIVSMINNGGVLQPSQTAAFTNSSNNNLSNVVVSGTTFSATVLALQGNGALAPAGTLAAVLNNTLFMNISACNGTAYQIFHSNYDIQTSVLTSTIPAGSAGISCPTATINFSPDYSVVQLHCAAEQIAADTPGSIELEPNNCDWTAGDTIWEPHPPTFGFNAHWDTVEAFNSQTVGSGILQQYVGAGITSSFNPVRLINSNSDSFYVGGGGLYGAPLWMTLTGPNSGYIRGEQPLGGAPIFFFGCGNLVCDPLINIWNLRQGAATLSWTASGNYYDTGASALHTGGVQSPILSTGDGAVLNGGVSLPAGTVALTSFNSVTQDLTGIGSYGAFGTGGLLDTTATVGATGFFAGLGYFGAEPSLRTDAFTDEVTPGTTVYSYVCTSNTAFGESLPTIQFSVTTASSTPLSAGHPVHIVCSAGFGGTSINVYRAVAAGSLAVGKICDHIPNSAAFHSQDPASCQDIGQTAGAPINTVDTTGSAHVSGLLDAHSVLTPCVRFGAALPGTAGLSESSPGSVSADTTTCGDGLGTFKGGGFQGTGTQAYIGTGASANKDLAGEITLAGGTGSYGFVKTLAIRPECFIHDHTTPANDLTNTFIVSPASLTVTSVGTADVIGYVCIGRN